MLIGSTLSQTLATEQALLTRSWRGYELQYPLFDSQFATLAQWLEHLFCKQGVQGSNP